MVKKNLKILQSLLVLKIVKLLFPSLNKLFDFCLEKILAFNLICLGFFLDDQRLYLSRNAEIPSNKASFGSKNIN